EKAAIIRCGVAFTARQDPEAEVVLERRAAEVSVPLVREGRELHVTPRGFTLDAQRLDLAGPGWRMSDVACGLLGVYQPGKALLRGGAARAATRGGPPRPPLPRTLPDLPARSAHDPRRRAQSGGRPRARGVAAGL